MGDSSTVAPSEASEPDQVGGSREKCLGIAMPIQILLDIRPFSTLTHADDRLRSIIEQARRVGEKAFWGNDCFLDCSTKQGWRLNIGLDPSNDDVLGFIVYRVEGSARVVHIQYIAVDERHRRRGIGTKLIKSLQQFVRSRLTRRVVDRIVCAVVPQAVPFYQTLQFRKGRRIDTVEGGTVAPCGRLEEQIPVQFQMEWKVPPLNRK
jgi:ribosomal protein S18 acetylase RimI-like enzyme